MSHQPRLRLPVMLTLTAFSKPRLLIFLLHTSTPASLARPQLPPDPSSGQPEDYAARRALLHTLAGVFLPLVPSITRPDHCTRPLWACAKTGYGWAGGADEVALAEALLGRLGEDGYAMLQQALPQAHSNLWWSLSETSNARLVAAQGQLLAASAECLVGMSARDMVPQDCANVLLACARLKHSPTHVPLVHHLTRRLAELREPSAQAQANALYALGELREDCGHVPHQEDLRQLVGAVVHRLRGGRSGAEVPGAFKPQEVSNMLLGCAKLGMEDGEAVQLLAAAAGKMAGRMESQGLANSVWALGKLLGVGDGGGGISLPSTAPSRGAGGDGTAALAVAQLLREVQRRLGPSRPKDGTAEHAFTSQFLSNLLYGMALLQPYMDTLPQAQGGIAGRPGGPSVTSFAAATHALAGECVRRSFRGFKPQEIANTTWALAKLDHADQGWFAAAAAAAQRPAFAGAALPMHWAQLWYALAIVRHRPPPGLVECTAGALEGQVLRPEPQACAMLLWSFAVLGVWEERLTGMLLGRLAELVERQQGQKGQGQGTMGIVSGRVGSQAPLVLVEQALANALWAVAVAGPGPLAAHAREVGVLLREAARRWEQGGGPGPGAVCGPFLGEHLHQLWQVQLELEAMEGGEGGEAAALSHIVPGAHRHAMTKGGDATAPGAGSLLAAMELAAQEARLGDAPTVSDLQQGVLAALRRMQGRQQQQQPLPQAAATPTQGAEGLPVLRGLASGSTTPVFIADVQREALVPALHCRIDVLVRLSDGREVAVEVDGPIHYLCNKPHTHTKDGPTTLRDRQLSRVFEHVSVPYWEWDALRGDKAAEERYMWGLLVGAEGAEERVRVGKRAGGAAVSRVTGRNATAAVGPGRGQVGEEAVAATAAASPQQLLRRRRQQQQQQEGTTAQVAGHGSAALGGEGTAPPPLELPGRQATGGAEGRRRRRSVEEGAAGDPAQGGQPAQVRVE